MSLNGKSFLERMKTDAREYKWSDGLWRMGVDLLLVNLSMLGAFLAWFFFYVTVLDDPHPRDLATRFLDFVKIYWLFWSFLALLVFTVSGFYTRTRGYSSRYKALVVFRAISLFMVAFVFADYFFFRSELIPRGVALLGWLFTLLTVGGVRMAKDVILRLYRVESKKRPRQIERVLVVGGAGYLGSLLVPQLLQRGYKVRVLDLYIFGEESLATVKSHPACELIRGDVRDIEAMVRAMQNCDAVVDLAAIVGDPACEENRPLALEVNRAATRMLLDIGRGYGVQRFLFASTCSVYGAADVMMDEMSKVVPLSTYARTKLDSESILLEEASETFHTTVLRLGTLFGLSPRMRFDLVVNLLTVRAVRLGKVTIFNGQQWRPFLHVEDAARAFIECMEAPAQAVSGEIFNVGGDNLNHQLNDIGEALTRMVPNVEIERIENADARNYRVSFEKVLLRIGFEPKRLLVESMQEMYDAIRAGKVEDYATAQFNNLAAVKAFSAAAGAEPSALGKLVALAGQGKE